jgi:hypothetical protein
VALTLLAAVPTPSTHDGGRRHELRIVQARGALIKFLLRNITGINCTMRTNFKQLQGDQAAALAASSGIGIHERAQAPGGQENDGSVAKNLRWVTGTSS